MATENCATVVHYLYFLLLLGLAWGQGPSLEESSCGTLFSGANFTGEEFRLRSFDQSVNLRDDFRASEFGWNATIGSVKVVGGCKLRVCNESYFDGECQVVREDISSLRDLLVNSVSCECSKKCKCSDIFMKRKTCARAYLNKGCNSCTALYTDLSGSGSSFPEHMFGKVKALRLRKGCTLRIYPEADHEGEEEIVTDEIVENFQGIIGSYDCSCNDDEFVPKAKPPRPESYPPFINVSANLDEVISQLKTEHPSHPGLLASYRSLKQGRSSKNAYILLLGSTGAGKSSAINLLFDSPVTKVGGAESTTTNIHEFRIPVPIDELGISNSELRVIDTPGLGDTRGLEQDAKFLATLDEFLSAHEELSNRTPNAVLIFHPFSDNRFAGVGSSFIKMIRGLDSFRDRLTDSSFSNVIFVLSHFCTETNTITRRPDAKLKNFKNVIEGHSIFPKPIFISVAENRAKDRELPLFNGFYKLPNNEFYPKNLFNKLELVTQSAGDLIGMSIFRSAFRDSDSFNASHATFPLVSSTNSKVPKYLDLLTNSMLSVNNTDVSRMLQGTWDRMDPELKRRFPGELPSLQKTLNILGISSEGDVPRTTNGILELFTGVKRNEAASYLLEHGLNITAPSFLPNPIAGHGYNVFKDEPLPSTPFLLGEGVNSELGYLIQKGLSCSLEQTSQDRFLVFESKEEYLNHRLHGLGIEGGIPSEIFSGSPKPGYTIRELFSSGNGSCTISASREYRRFQFVLNEKLGFTPRFASTVRTLPPFNQSDYENVQTWKDFFAEYGTHVVKSASGGGSIELRINSPLYCNPEVGQVFLNLIKFAEDRSFEVSSVVNGSASPFEALEESGVSHTLVFHGGESQYHIITDLTKVSLEEAGRLLGDWKKSLKTSPVMLNTELRLQPMSQVVRKLGQNISSEIERATSLLFNSSLRYSPPQQQKLAQPGADRANTAHMTEILKVMEESTKQVEQLMEEFKAVQLETAEQARATQLEAGKMEEERARAAAEFEEMRVREAAEHMALMEELRRKWEEEDRLWRARVAAREQEEKERREREAECNTRWKRMLLRRCRWLHFGVATGFHHAMS